MKIEKKITLLKKRLSKNLPGWESQKKMAVMPINSVTRLAFIPPKNAKLSAVAIILFIEHNKLKFLLTRRSSNVDHHKGQVSLPGGAQEKGESFRYTSLREAQEEIGISADLNLIGKLGPLYTPVSGFSIHPIVWFTEKRPKTIINKNEVESIYTIELDELENVNTLSSKPIKVKGIKMNAPSFKFNDCNCWGATAMILSELKDCLAEV